MSRRSHARLQLLQTHSKTSFVPSVKPFTSPRRRHHDRHPFVRALFTLVDVQSARLASTEKNRSHLVLQQQPRVFPQRLLPRIRRRCARRFRSSVPVRPVRRRRRRFLIRRRHSRSTIGQTIQPLLQLIRPSAAFNAHRSRRSIVRLRSFASSSTSSFVRFRRRRALANARLGLTNERTRFFQWSQRNKYYLSNSNPNGNPRHNHARACGNRNRHSR